MTAWLKDFVDRLGNEASAAERARMETVFLASTRYEYQFWEAPFQDETWPA